MIKKGINSMKKKEEKNKELSSIKPVKNDSDENTIYLPDNSTVSIEDIITKKSSKRYKTCFIIIFTIIIRTF